MTSQVQRISDFLELCESSVLTSFFFWWRTFIYSFIFSSPFHPSAVRMQKRAHITGVQMDEPPQSERLRPLSFLLPYTAVSLNTSITGRLLSEASFTQQDVFEIYPECSFVSLPYNVPVYEFIENFHRLIYPPDCW